MSKHVQRILSFVVLAALLSCLLPPSAAAVSMIYIKYMRMQRMKIPT